MKIKFSSNTINNFHNILIKRFTTRERTIGWPPLIISGPPGVGKVISTSFYLLINF